ncbi:effector-associated domain 2-containing protein [Streptomyces sp. MK7]|uniref:VMAP-C domain-containing protein n=1 Tax=Streptomyces sp. MK7 TaxID=3067635 RepID=UPI00292DA065|nr:hypothetical protein [Streptomyces sp. MK7]
MQEPDARGALGELVEILVALDGLRDDPMRAVIIDELGPQISSRIPRHPAVRQEVLAIVQTCLRVPGGLVTLADVLTAFHGDDRKVQRFRQLVEALSLPLELREDERRELMTVLGSVPGRPWLAAYLEAAGRVVERLPDDLSEALAVLEDLPAPRGEAPRVLRFTQALVAGRRMPEQLRDEVHRWNTRLTRRLGLPEPPPLPHREPGAPPDEDALLVLSLQPYLPRGESCLLSAWLGYGQDGWLPLVQEDEPRPMSQVPPMISEFMAVVRDYTGGRPPRRVEFLLPRSLLDLPVDQWVMDVRPSAAGPAKSALGAHCAVVVRDLERATDPFSRGLWTRRWDAFREGGTLPEDEVLWLDPARRSVGYGPARAPDSVCAVVIEPPAPDNWSRTATADALATALDTGVPVVLWDRRTGPADRAPRGGFRRVARELMHGGTSQQLPERVRSLRAEALRSAEVEWGRHIALLWDDPTCTVGAGGALRWP